MTNKTYFAFARHALVAGLRHISIQPGDEIAVPELICRDILSSLAAVGAIARFYPVDRELKPLSHGEADSVQAVLMVNYFGFPQEISNFTRLWPEAILIEDNAHGFLSRDAYGSLLGARTDIGITSIRKTIRLPEGAYLSTTMPVDPLLKAAIDERPPSLSYQCRALVATIEKRTHLPIHGLMRTAIREVRRITTGSALPISNSISEFELPEPRSISRHSLQLIEKVSEENEVSRRRMLFAEFAKCARSSNMEVVFPLLPEGCAPYGFPFYSTKLSREFVRLTRHHHCEAITWPDLPGSVDVPNNHFYRQLRLVNFL